MAAPAAASSPTSAFDPPSVASAVALLASLVVGALFLVRLMAAPVVGLCLGVVPNPAAYAAEVALSAVLTLWGAGAATWSALGFGSHSPTRRATGWAWALSALLLVVGGTGYFLSISWGARCFMWPFNPI